MAKVTFKGSPVTTVGDLPAAGAAAPSFTLAGRDLSDVTLAGFAGKTVVLNIFPSIDTPVCAASVRRFNAEAAALGDTVVLCVSADLPFAHGRFCSVEGLDKVVTLSVFRAPEAPRGLYGRVPSPTLVSHEHRRMVAGGRFRYVQHSCRRDRCTNGHPYALVDTSKQSHGVVRLRPVGAGAVARRHPRRRCRGQCC